MKKQPAMNPNHFARAFALVLLVNAASCAGRRPDDLGIHDGLLGTCPSSPNCVSSESTDLGHMIPAFYLTVDSAQGWKAVRDAVAAMPRTTIITETADYLHAQCASRLFGFVDDLELQLRRDPGTVAVRSASRIGYSDMGVNRKRIEMLRNELYRVHVLEHEIGGSD